LAEYLLTWMRKFIAHIALLLAAQLSAFGYTNEITLLKYQSRRAAHEWRISEARILATPEWKMGSKKVPVSPDKAWQIAQDWFKKEGRGGAGDFVSIEIRSFDPGGYSKKLRGKCYYRVECIPAPFDSMLVVILMDGTVLEPLRIPNLPTEEIQ
jgi:hypothetical protein